MRDSPSPDRGELRRQGDYASQFTNMSDLDLLAVSGGMSTVLYSFGTTGSGQSSGSSEARVWCGDTGDIFVYNVPNHLYRSSDNGNTFTDIYPTPGVSGMSGIGTNGRVTALCEFGSTALGNPNSTGSGENKIEIFVMSSSGSNLLVLTTSGSVVSWTNVQAVFYNGEYGVFFPVFIVDAIEDSVATAGILAGNKTSNPVVGDTIPVNDHRVFRSTDDYTFTVSDDGMMPGQRLTLELAGFTFAGFQMDEGVAITDLETAAA